MSELHRRYELTPVINLSGPLTMYGTSVSSAAVIDAAAEALRHHWNMDELFQRAGERIAQWSGAEAGVLTACSASGITLSVAACMTGPDAGRIGRLPDASGMPHEVIIQKGHAVNFGAPIEQMIRLAGATAVEVGTVNRTTPVQIETAIGPDTAAGMFVISHHTTLYGNVQLERFIEIFHSRGLPVIIDGAAQDHQIERMVASGADLIVLSGQKYLSGPTAGVVCGRKDLIKALYMQNAGIGRTMKVGKEGIFGTIVAIEERMNAGVDSWESEQRSKAERLAGLIGELPGIAISIQKDLVGQPVYRVLLDVDAERLGLDAAQLATLLKESSPSIKPRDHHTDEGWFLLEPVHITGDDMQFVADRLREIATMPESERTSARERLGAMARSERPAGDAFIQWLA
ncbi:MAG: aminotransferase class V-fold PLP-dependent enzyme [Thermomicrobiales bacterium]